jgi:hypothetical protein
MSIKRAIRVKWLRFLKRTNFLKSYNIFQDSELSSAQKKGIKIFERAITTRGVEIATHTESDIIYIVVDEIYLILNGNDLEIINGRFQYYLHVNDKIRTLLRSRVYDVLNRRALKIRERIQTKNDRTLDSILEDITSIKEKESTQ